VKDGVGGALRAGYNYAKNDIILSCDADFSYSLRDLKRLYEKLIQEHYDMVVGSRHGGASRYEIPRWSIALKYAVSRSGNWLLRALFRMPVHDFSANCRALRRALWQKLDTHDNGNFFLFETIFFAERTGARIGEVPILFLDRKKGASKINHIFEAPKALYKMVVFLIRYSLLRGEIGG
jgi:glycosyltransferase involved in cell wall biosynthesis